MKKTLLVLALTGLFSTLAQADEPEIYYASSEGLPPAASGAPLEELPPLLIPIGPKLPPNVTDELKLLTVLFNGHVAGQYARNALLSNSLVFAENVFDQASDGEGLWAKANYGSLKNDIIKLTQPTVYIGYKHAVNNELKLGLTGFYGQQKNKTLWQLSDYFESKNNVFGLAFNAHYQPSLWFADAMIGGWLSRNQYTITPIVPDTPAPTTGSSSAKPDAENGKADSGDGHTASVSLADLDKKIAALSAPRHYKRTQKGVVLAARLGIEYPLNESLTMTPSLQGTWAYTTSQFAQSRAYQAGTFGVNLSGDWKVQPQFKVGADLGLDWVLTNTWKTIYNYGYTTKGSTLLHTDQGLKTDWRWKAGLHAKYSATDRLSFGVEAAYQRYQKFKLGGMTFQLSGQYRF